MKQLRLYWSFFKLDYRINRATKGRAESFCRAFWQMVKPLPF
jgi:hypothetical protein